MKRTMSETGSQSEGVDLSISVGCCSRRGTLERTWVRTNLRRRPAADDVDLFTIAWGVRPQFIHSRARDPCLITVAPILLPEAWENANVLIRSRTIWAIPEIELGGNHV